MTHHYTGTRTKTLEDILKDRDQSSPESLREDAAIRGQTQQQTSQILSAPPQQQVDDDGGVTGMFSRGISNVLGSVGGGIATVIDAVDHSRRYGAWPALGFTLAAMRGQLDELDSYEDARQYWRESNIPAAGKFVPELIADPAILLGGGLGLAKGVGSKIATSGMRGSGLFLEPAKGFAATRAAVRLENVGKPMNDFGLDMSRGIVPSRETLAKVLPAFKEVGILKGSVDDGMKFYDDLRAAVAAKGGRSEELASMASYLKQGVVAERLGPLTRILGPTDVLAETIYSVPFKVAAPVAGTAWKMAGRIVTTPVNAAFRSSVTGKLTSFLAPLTQYSSDVNAWQKAGRNYLGRKGFIGTQALRESIETQAVAQTHSVSKAIERVEAMTGLAPDQIIAGVRSNDPKVTAAFNNGVLDGADDFPPLRHLREGLALTEPEELAYLYNQSAQSSFARFELGLRDIVKRGMVATSGALAGPEVQPGAIEMMYTRAMRVFRPTVLATPTFMADEFVDNFSRAGAFWSHTPAHRNLMIDVGGLDESYRVANMSLAHKYMEQFTFGMLPPERVRLEGRLANLRNAGVPDSAEQIRKIEARLAEIPESEDPIREAVGFASAPERRAVQEGAEKLPYIGDVDVGGLPVIGPVARGARRFVESSQSRMNAGDKGAISYVKHKATSAAFLRDWMSADPRLLDPAGHAIRSALEKVAHMDLPHNVREGVFGDATNILAGTKDAVAEAIERANVDAFALDEITNSAYWRTLPDEAKFRMSQYIEEAAESGVPGRIAVQNAIDRFEPLAFQSAPTKSLRNYLLLDETRQNLYSVYRNLDIDRANLDNQVLAGYMGTIDLLRGLERHFSPDASKFAPTMSRKLEASLSAFRYANDDLNVVGAQGISDAVKDTPGRVSDRYLPLLTFDGQAAGLIYRRLQKASRHIYAYGEAVARKDPKARRHLDRVGKLMPEWRDISENAGPLAPSKAAAMFATSADKMWKRFMAAKVAAADDVYDMAGNVLHGVMSYRNASQVSRRMLKEIFANVGETGVRRDAAARVMERYGMPEQLGASFDRWQESYEELGQLIMQKWRGLEKNGAVEQVDKALAGLRRLAHDYNNPGIVAEGQKLSRQLHDLYRQLDGIARQDDVMTTLKNSFAYHANTAGQAAVEKQMVDYSYQTGFDRSIGFVSLFPTWPMRLYNFTANQIVRRPSFLVAMNHFATTDAYDKLGLGVGNGFFIAPHFRASVLRFLASKGEFFIHERMHPIDQMSNFINALGIYPGPAAQLAVHTLGGTLNKTGITTQQTQVDPAFSFAPVPPQIQWMSDILRATAGLEFDDGVLPVPFTEGGKGVFNRAIQREMAAEVRRRIKVGEEAAERPLHPDELVDIQREVARTYSSEAHKKISARSLTLGLVPIPGLRHRNEEEMEALNSVREVLEGKGHQVPNTRRGIVNGFYNELTDSERRRLREDIPGLTDFLTLPPGAASAADHARHEAKQQYHKLSDLINSERLKEQRKLDQAFLRSMREEPEDQRTMTAAMWRQETQLRSSQATNQKRGLQRSPEIADYFQQLASGQSEDPVEAAIAGYYDMEIEDTNANGVEDEVDRMELYDRQRRYLDELPDYVREEFHRRRRRWMTPLQIRYDEVKQLLPDFWAIPKEQKSERNRFWTDNPDLEFFYPSGPWYTDPRS